MTQQHPINPPPELVQHWSDEALTASGMLEVKMEFAALAAQWGADTELEACCEWIPKATPWDAEQLRAARRPSSPSLKEQALEALERFSVHAHAYADEMMKDFDLISRALEQLDDNE